MGRRRTPASFACFRVARLRQRKPPGLKVQTRWRRELPWPSAQAGAKADSARCRSTENLSSIAVVPVRPRVLAYVLQPRPESCGGWHAQLGVVIQEAAEREISSSSVRRVGVGSTAEGAGASEGAIGVSVSPCARQPGEKSGSHAHWTVGPTNYRPVVSVSAITQSNRFNTIFVFALNRSLWARRMGRRALDSRQGEERNGAQRGESAQRMARSSGKPPASGERTWSAGLRPASRGSAKPAPNNAADPTNLPAANAAVAAPPRSAICGAPPEPVGVLRRASSPGTRRAPKVKAAPRQSHAAANGAAIADLRAESRGQWSAGLRPASRGSAKPAPMTVRRTDVSGAPPAQSGLRRSRCAQRCRPEVGVPVPVRRLCSIRTAPLAPLRGAVPTGRSAFPCLRVACAQSGLRRPPACGGLCRPEVGVPLPARHRARGGTRRDASPGVCAPFAPRPEGERGESSLSHFPPHPLGSERSSLPSVFRALR